MARDLHVPDDLITPDEWGDFPHRPDGDLLEALADGMHALGATLEWNGLCAGNPAVHATPHFANDVFLMHGGEDVAYDGPQFQSGDLAVVWYKHSRRSVSTSRPVTVEELTALLARCRASLGPDVEEPPAPQPFVQPTTEAGRRVIAASLNFGAVYGVGPARGTRR